MKKETMISLLIVLLLALTLIHGANAQNAYRVVVTLKTGERVKGELLRTTSDSLILLHNNTEKTASMNRADIDNIRVRKSKAVSHGISIGALVGAGAGGLYGLADYSSTADCKPGQFCIDFGPGLPMAAGAFLGAIAGALVGGIGSTANEKFEVKKNADGFNQFLGRFETLPISSNNVHKNIVP